MKNKLGLVHIYFGDGKGKTTASMGIAARSAGCGYNVLIAQFLKDGDSSEFNCFKNMENIKIFTGKCEKGFTFKMTPEQKKRVCDECRERFDTVKNLFYKGECEVIVLDEILDAINCGFIKEEELTSFLNETKDKAEVIITGRDPGEALCEKADYITEIKKVKHPYDKGVPARKGIEM